MAGSKPCHGELGLDARKNQRALLLQRPWICGPGRSLRADRPGGRTRHKGLSSMRKAMVNIARLGASVNIPSKKVLRQHPPDHKLAPGLHNAEKGDLTALPWTDPHA